MDLTKEELESLRQCPASLDMAPEPGNRTAYVRRRLKNEGLVRTLWVSDDEADEFYFTWQRTPKGDAVVDEAAGR